MFKAEGQGNGNDENGCYLLHKSLLNTTLPHFLRKHGSCTNTGKHTLPAEFVRLFVIWYL